MRKAAIASADKVTQPMTVHVIEHAITDKVIDTGKPGDTSGDLLTWHNPLFNATDARRVGHDQGECVRMSPKQGTWECRWINWVEGGTGMYRNARGTMTLKFRNGGTEFDFIFNILP